MDDVELLRDYADNHSESAFEELVARHVDHVYCTALRQVRNPHVAQEVTQAVFVILANKASSLRAGTILSGWLFRTTRFTAMDAMKKAARRQRHEQEAAQMNPIATETGTDATWEQVAPCLNDALASLGEQDRNAIMLRFFEKKNLNEVGRALGVNEEAARKRAVEKLRGFLVKRKVAVSATTLLGALSTNAVQAAPAGFASAVAAAAMLHGTAVTTSTLAVAKGTLKVMAWTKLKIAGAVVLAGTIPIGVQWNLLAKLRRENQELREQNSAIQQLRGARDELERLRAQNQQMAQLRRDAQDVLKLRSEVGQLRREQADLAKLRDENAVLKNKIRPERPNPLRLAAPDAAAQDEAQRLQGIAKMTAMRDWTLAIIKYADANQGVMPADFAQARPYVSEGLATLLDLDRYEILNHGALDKIASPAKTIVVKEKQAWQTGDGKWAKAYGFADGHSEIHAEANGEFERWENARQ